MQKVQTREHLYHERDLCYIVSMSDAKESVAKVRVTKQTLAAWKRAAKSSGVSLSEWIRCRIDGVAAIEIAEPTGR